MEAMSAVSSTLTLQHVTRPISALTCRIIEASKPLWTNPVFAVIGLSVFGGLLQSHCIAPRGDGAHDKSDLINWKRVVGLSVIVLANQMLLNGGQRFRGELVLGSGDVKLSVRV